MYQSNAERIDAQYELEKLSMTLGISRYRDTLAKEGDSAVSAGQQLIKAAMRPMEEALNEWLKVTADGLASRSAGVFHFINQLDPVVTCWLTAHTAIRLLASRATLTAMSTALAMQMEAAVNMEQIAKEQPHLAAKMAKRLKTMSDVGNKLVFIRKGGVMADVKIIQWDNNVRVRMGSLLLTMFAQSTGLVAIDTIQEGHNRSSTVVRATEACRRWLEESHARCELLTPARLPMVCEPKSWTSPFNGGYLTKEMRRPVVKTRHKAYLSELKEWEMPNVYASINALQGTEWSVNVAIYETIKALWESGAATGALPSRFDAPMPARSWAEGETPADDVLHTWKVGAARTHEGNAKQGSKRLQLITKLWTAEMMLERNNRFHYVYNLDWRGRLYPVGSDLNPQGDDVAKAMLQFHKAVPLGEEGAYWLAVHGANTFGIDKVSFEERIKWVEDHSDAIVAAGNDPTCGTMWWTEADSPFMFLAFCIEWAKLQNWVDGGAAEADFPSFLPVAFDGACNGLQNFSAMLRDPVGGAATGLVPGEKPADIYSEVARAAQVLIDQAASEGSEVAQRWVGKMTRKLAKRNTMTVPYGVTTSRHAGPDCSGSCRRWSPRASCPARLGERCQGSWQAATTTAIGDRGGGRPAAPWTG
jgi:DNA-directed RNA polymerase